MNKRTSAEHLRGDPRCDGIGDQMDTAVFTIPGREGVTTKCPAEMEFLRRFRTSKIHYVNWNRILETEVMQPISMNPISADPKSGENRNS